MSAPAAESRAHEAIRAAESALVPARVRLLIAEGELRTMMERADLLLVDDQTLRDLLADWAEVRSEMREVSARHSLAGGTYGPNATPEMDEEWAVVCRREWPLQYKLLAIGDLLLQRRRERAAPPAEEAAQ